MSSPASRVRNAAAKPAPDGKKGEPQALRVLAASASAQHVSSVVMPKASTELSEMLAHDRTLFVRRPAAFHSAAAPDQPNDSPPVGDATTRSVSATSAQDPELAQVIEAWPSLSRGIRAAIAAMVRETGARR